MMRRRVQRGTRCAVPWRRHDPDASWSRLRAPAQRGGGVFFVCAGRGAGPDGLTLSRADDGYRVTEVNGIRDPPENPCRHSSSRSDSAPAETGKIALRDRSPETRPNAPIGRDAPEGSPETPFAAAPPEGVAMRRDLPETGAATGRSPPPPIGFTADRATATPEEANGGLRRRARGAQADSGPPHRQRLHSKPVGFAGADKARRARPPTLHPSPGSLPLAFKPGAETPGGTLIGTDPTLPRASSGSFNFYLAARTILRIGNVFCE